MVAEKFQIDSVKITGKFICETKKTHAPKQNSPPGFYHYHPGRKKSPIPPKQHFLKIYFLPSRKGWGGGIVELKKLPKLNLRGYWSQVFINSTIFATFTFLISIWLCHNLASRLNLFSFNVLVFFDQGNLQRFSSFKLKGELKLINVLNLLNPVNHGEGVDFACTMSFSCCNFRKYKA